MADGGAFIGKWKLVSSENFDEYLKALGVNFVLRKLANAAKPTLTVKKEGDTWTMISESTVRTITTSFKMGEEFTEDRADGVSVKSLLVLENEGTLMKQTQQPEDETKPPTTITREIKDGKMIVARSGQAAGRTAGNSGQVMAGQSPLTNHFQRLRK